MYETVHIVNLLKELCNALNSLYDYAEVGVSGGQKKVSVESEYIGIYLLYVVSMYVNQFSIYQLRIICNMIVGLLNNYSYKRNVKL